MIDSPSMVGAVPDIGKIPFQTLESTDQPCGVLARPTTVIASWAKNGMFSCI